MTWFFTHFSLEGLIIWMFLSKEKKEFFKEHKNYFLILNLFAILPDLDYFFGIHRSFTHSFIMVMLIFVIGLTISHLIKHKYPSAPYYTFLITGFWFFHIILDLDYYGKLAVFYPLDTTVYDFSPFAIMSTLFYPLIVGFGIKVTQEDISTGLSTYLSNISPASRYKIFQSATFNLYLDELLLHLLILLLWIIIIGFSTISIPINKIERLTTDRRLFRTNFLQQIKYRIRSSFGITGIMLILLGFMLGPIIGLEHINENENNTTFEFSSNKFRPATKTSIKIPKQLLERPKIKINATILNSDNNSHLSSVGIVSSPQLYSKYIANITSLFNQYYSENQTTALENRTLELKDFQSAYKNKTSKFLSNPDIEILNQEQNLFESYETEFIIAIILTDFQVTENTVENGTEKSVSLITTVKYERFVNYSLGIGTIIMGTLIIFIPDLRRKENDNSK